MATQGSQQKPQQNPHTIFPIQIAKFSLVRAAERITTARRKREDTDAELRSAEASVAAAKTLTQHVSEVGDDRCVSAQQRVLEQLEWWSNIMTVKHDGGQTRRWSNTTAVKDTHAYISSSLPNTPLCCDALKCT